jgi:hypothetical protein
VPPRYGRREILDHGSLPNHWGLPGMKERAAKIGAELSIRARSVAGTEIEVRIGGRLAYKTEHRRGRGFLRSVGRLGDARASERSTVDS